MGKIWRQLGWMIAGTALLSVGVCQLWRGKRSAPVYAQETDTGYANPATCIGCHNDIAQTYRQTGMGRSFRRASADDRIVNPDRNTLYNKASDRYYTMIVKGDKLFEQRYQIGFEGKKTSYLEKKIDYVIGSGNHAKTYLHRSAGGQLIELPVSWYSEMGGYWQMSPGFDSPTQQDFRRPIPSECMFCHNAYPRSDLRTGPALERNTFGEDIPEGIDCQRCHGPGKAHVRAASTGGSIQSIQAAIVNPATLSRDRQMDVCMQCHLETSSSLLPNSIRKTGRTIFSYRPGEALQDYELFLDRKPGAGFDDRFEVAHQAYRLRKSACFLKSKMTCITCHDPHEQIKGPEAITHYVAVCRSCHTSVHSSRIPKDGSGSAKGPVAGANCLTCHMWKRRTEDAVHVVMTDHFIQRFKPRRSLLEPIKETTPTYRGEVIPYYPTSLTDIPNGDLYRALAQTEGNSNLEAGTFLMRQAIERGKPTDPEFYLAMGAAYSKEQQYVEAVAWYEEALRRRPDYGEAQRALTTTLLAAGDFTEALRIGDKAVAIAHPDPNILTMLGTIYLHQGRLSEAKGVLKQALTINADLPDTNVYLGLVSVRESSLGAAESFFRRAIDLQPDFAEPHNNLAGILAHEHNYAEAAFEYQKALEYDPTNAQVYRNYAAFLMSIRSTSRAIEELRRGVHLNPQSSQLHFALGSALASQGEMIETEHEYRLAIESDKMNGEANLKLADILAHQGKAGEARPFYLNATESADPEVRQAAIDALRK
jgi:tetratricopeptide (TPR) repeat protein